MIKSILFNKFLVVDLSSTITIFSVFVNFIKNNTKQEIVFNNFILFLIKVLFYLFLIYSLLKIIDNDLNFILNTTLNSFLISSLKIPYNNNENSNNINPYFITGFTDGDGSFYFSIKHNKKTNRFGVQLAYELSAGNNTNSNTTVPLKDSFTYKVDEGAKVTVSPETVAKISDKIIDNLPGISSTVASGIATGTGGTGAMMAASRLVKNTPMPIAAKASVIIGMGTAGAAGVSIGSQVGSTVGRNINEYLESQIVNSPFNNDLPEGRAPTPNPEFSINSMLDNFELSNWSFSFTLPVGDNSPLEALLVYLLICLIGIFIFAVYLAFLNIMRVFSINYSSSILSYIKDSTNLLLLPVWFRSLLNKSLEVWFNIYTKFSKYLVIFSIVLFFFYFFLSAFIVMELIINLDQYVEVYQTFYKK